MTGRIARGLLGLIEAPYAAAVRHRNRRYDRGAAETLSVPVPVISVGNLTLGGTGKTPMVKWIARWLANRGVRAALISRGYGGDRGGQNDEALELAQALPDTPHVQNADRVAAAHHAIREFGAEALLLDDAFQHRRIARDLNIVLLDATEPFGFGRVFPRGMLREPIEGLSRADVVCLTRSDLVDSCLRTRTRDEAMRLAPDAVWCEASHEPAGLITAKGDQRSLAELQGRRVAAFCGIGNPAAFRRTLEAAGCDVAAWRSFPDHHRFSAVDEQVIEQLADRSDAELVVCTHKDLVKVRAAGGLQEKLVAVVVEMTFLSGQDAFTAKLDQTIAARMQQG